MAATKKKTPNNHARKNISPAAHGTEANPNTIPNQVIPYVLGFVAVFVTLCFIWKDATGFVGVWLRTLFYGLFSCAAVLIPPLILNVAIFWRRDIEKGNVHYKLIFSFIILVFTSVLIYIVTGGGIPGDAGKLTPAAVFSIPAFWSDGIKWTEGGEIVMGGVFGGTFGWLLSRAVGRIGTIIISAATLLIFGIFLFGLTPHAIYVMIKYHLHEARQRRIEDKKTVPAYLRPKQNDNIVDENEEEPLPVPKRRRNAKLNISSVDDTVDNSTDAEVWDESNDIAADDQSEWNADDPKNTEGIPLLRRRGKSSVESETNETAEVDPAVFDNVLRRQQEYAVSGKDTSDIGFIQDGEGDPDTADGHIGKADDPPFDAAGSHVITEEIVHDTARQVNPAKKASGDDPLSPDLLNAFIEHSDEDGEGSALPENRIITTDPDTGEELSTEELALARRALVTNQKLKKPAPPVYRYPPATLLATPVRPKNDDLTEELKTTSKRLVDTLTSFKVRTHIVNISRGPTITRYELAPEEGVRVRQIANLVDDISLNLATTGVRIEAPIPGKSAVGIEVPNRIVATVFLRELIEDKDSKFEQAQSKITVCLGKDVAGEPIYVDIAKMPHLLIAGATGMGKSVCINSMIVSLLYKASPEEVKLILIDPKKVELNIYNGLPHLLVPVVSDPKKAAGSLAWAVTEMERRFTLIEEVGVRDLKSYNKAVADNPEREYLPQIVIIIDELADLMMTAHDDVEESICRLAQKARAAGMHLIVGTQRPSVDVITGLIKANIPSRIAFTVASQVDSRTIIDIIGAEKLIGRGDMLYAPVGATKPIRVQGAFVSEGEIEAILDYIKKHYGVGTYDDEVIESIEREAAHCGNGKKGVSGDADGGLEDEADPMLKAAIELAVDSGKISTSLIQRRLSLGYGRAAKLIDRMERMGIVSPPEGQKPRNVLINRQQFMEMVLNSDIEN